MQPKPSTLYGAGLGFRRELIQELTANEATPVDFFEVAPENWIGCGGRFRRDLRRFTERFTFTAHGLSLSLGGTEPLDREFLNKLKLFLREHQITLFTEHLSWCTDDGHLYDLLPLPCTGEAVIWVSDRIRQVQDYLEMPIGIENVSYYFTPPNAEMSEPEFISAIVEEANCFLHLDVNNVYVNSQNFEFDPTAYLQALPLHAVSYLHVAGHYQDNSGLLIDTHGDKVIDPVWQLLAQAYQKIPSPTLPTCLERDFNIPKLSALLAEVEEIRRIQGVQQPEFKAYGQSIA